MKKQLFTIAATAATLFTGFMADAAIIRCNNTLPAGTRQYATLATAYAAAASGDTIYIEPSPTSYGDLTLTKQLTIVGNGYFLNENYPNYSNKNNSVVGNVRFDAGSEGTRITGLTIGIIYAFTSNITIQRNKIDYIDIRGSVNNILIQQNYLNEIYSGSSYNGSSLVASNNFFTNIYAKSVDVGGNGTASYENNVFQSNITINNATFQNNIFLGTTITGTNNNLSYNIATSANLLPAGQNNLNGQSDLFLTTGTTDGKWQLDPNSAAKGAGFGGVDCGIFGGPNPYVLSGIPSFPYVTNFIVPANSNGNTLNFVFTAKSNK